MTAVILKRQKTAKRIGKNRKGERTDMDLTTQKEKETEIIDRVFFIAGMLGVLVVALCVIWWKVTGKSPIPPVPPCMIHAVTGIYCPGCGGTRAAYALLCGKPLLSLYYHPIVLYTVVVGAAFLVTQTIGRLSRGRFRAVVHFRPVYLWIALALVVINCFVKNFILLYFHIPLL